MKNSLLTLVFAVLLFGASIEASPQTSPSLSNPAPGGGYQYINPFNPPNYLADQMAGGCGLPSPAPDGYHYEWDTGCLASMFGGPAYVAALTSYFACTDGVTEQYQEDANQAWRTYQTARSTYLITVGLGGSTTEIAAARQAMLAALGAYRAIQEASSADYLQCEVSLMDGFGVCGCIKLVKDPVKADPPTTPF